MAPEHFMYLGLEIWKLLANVMVDCYLANSLICNNRSALRICKLGLSTVNVKVSSLLKWFYGAYYVRADRSEALSYSQVKRLLTGFARFEREPNKDVRENVSVSQRLLTGESSGRFLLLKSN